MPKARKAMNQITSANLLKRIGRRFDEELPFVLTCKDTETARSPNHYYRNRLDGVLATLWLSAEISAAARPKSSPASTLG
jgi:hypothetical protein